MALLARVTARIPSRRLVELTNAGSLSATSYDAAILGVACDDAESYFAERCGATYDDTKVGDQRVAVAIVVGVLIYNATGNDEDLQKALTAADSYAKVRGRDRSPGATSSELTRDTEVESGETIAPWSDLSSWDGYSPSSP